MSDLKKLMTKMNEVAIKIAKGRSGCANWIIIERTNPRYDDLKEILEKRNEKKEHI